MVTLFYKIFCSFGIVIRLVGVVAAIDLNNKVQCGSTEINDIWIDRILPPEMNIKELVISKM